MEKITVQQLIQKNKIDLLGKIVCFPTDTVYGVGAMIDDKEGIDKIFRMKGRDQDKPLANLCANVEQIQPFIEEIQPFARELMNRYWPGALTLIFKTQEGIQIRNTKETIGFRMPNSEIALSILRRFSIMATTSVNMSGNKELNTLEEIEEMFGNQLDYLVIDQVELSKISSTVVDVRGEKSLVLRQGDIVLEK